MDARIEAKRAEKLDCIKRVRMAEKEMIELLYRQFVYNESRNILPFLEQHSVSLAGFVFLADVEQTKAIRVFVKRLTRRKEHLRHTFANDYLRANGFSWCIYERDITFDFSIIQMEAFLGGAFLSDTLNRLVFHYLYDNGYVVCGYLKEMRSMEVGVVI